MAREGVFLKRRINDQLLIVLTILLSLLLFVIAPMQANGVISGTALGVIFGVVLIPATVMVWGNPMAVGAILVALVVARAVFARGKVTYHRIVGGVLLYLTIGLTFVALFGFLLILEPNTFNIPAYEGNFSIGKLIYFSFVTLTTMGYGDIVPLHPYARGVANIEAIIGQLYPATLLARLVTLELAIRR
jgi:Ion channel